MGLAPDQRLAAWERGIRTLLITSDHRKAAEEAGVNLQTWHIWRKTAEWQALFEIRREQAGAVGVEKLGTLFHQALDVFADAMRDTMPMQTRLKAATEVAKLIGRTQDIDGARPMIDAIPATVSAADAAAELRRRRGVVQEAAALLPGERLPADAEDDEDGPFEVDE